MAKETKVYEYRRDPVRDTLVSAFRKRRGQATVADLVAFTGLPKHQVESELPAVADEYGGRLAVTSSGEILYSFPRGLASRYRGFGPGLKRFWKAARKGLATAATILFKGWIMVMLVGYFVLFVALALLAVVASMAVSMSGNDRNRGRSRGGAGGLMLVGRLVETIVRIWFYSEAFKSPDRRAYERDLRDGRRSGLLGEARPRGERRPLSKAVFSFVFGEPDPNAGHGLVERRAFVAMARANKGIVLLEDFMAVTGLSPEEAERAVNRYLYEFEGTPEVSEDGTVYYRFDALLQRARVDDEGAADSPLARVRPFSANPPKSNRWYAVINGFNLLFGSYFLYHALAYGSTVPKTMFSYLYYFVGTLAGQVAANPVALVAAVLGAVPVAFSALFWLVPALRSLRLKRENERIKEANLRRVIAAKAMARPGAVVAPDPSGLPEAARPADRKAADRIVNELAAYEDGEPGPDGRTWRLKELERKLADIERLRAGARPGELGGTVFDTES